MENLTFKIVYLYSFVENNMTSTCSIKDKKNAMFYHGMLKETRLELFKNDSIVFRIDREFIIFFKFKISEIVILENQLNCSIL